MKNIKMTILILTLTLYTFTSHAYILSQGGVKSNYILIDDKTDSRYTGVVNKSIQSWNNAVPSITIKETNGVAFEIVNGYYTDGWLGYYKYYYDRKWNIYKVTIMLNDRLLDDKPDVYKQSVMVHELGHLLGLGDNPPGVSSIMRYDRNRYANPDPEIDDINGVIEFHKDINTSSNKPNKGNNGNKKK